MFRKLGFAFSSITVIAILLCVVAVCAQAAGPAGPSITGVSPGSGVVGTLVTISGANFGWKQQGGSTITFGGVQATPTSWSAGSIATRVPAGAVTGNVVVTVGGQASNGFGFIVTVPGPSITNVSPGSGIVGTSVTITGANFGGAQGGSTITFGGVQATPTSWSAGSIVAPVPAGAVTGNVVVMVGGQASNGSSFTVTVAGPSITNVSPGSGIVGTSVTITGANFGGAQGGSTVTFGGVQAIPTSWSAGSIVTPVPAGAVTGNVVVMVGGQASNGFGFTVPGSGGGTNGYTYQRAVTINANRVPNTDQTNFPVLIYGTYSYLATVANGGSVTNANGYDMIFTSDSAGSNLLKWELVNYNAATGAVEVWVKVPTVSHSANTMIYMWYGNSAVSTFQGGAAGGVWDGNYAGVYHLPNGTTLSANDSTGNENNGTILNGAIASGEIGGGANFNGANAEITTSYIQNSVAAYSIEAWVKTSSMNAAVVVQDRGGWGGHSLTFGLDGANGCGSGVGCGSISGLPSPAGKLLFGDDSNGIFIGAEGTSALNDNNWHHIVGTWSASSGSSLAASQFTLYVDGAKVGSPGTISAGSDTSPVNGSGGTFIGYHQAWNAYYNGVLDEVRISTAVRSADWITAEYNNESNPSSFYSIGAAVSGGGGTSSPVITSLSPTAGPAGTTVTISGSNFGSSQGSSTVRFNGTTAAPTSWSGASITVPVPTGAGTGNVVVTVSGAASNGFGFTMTAPAPSITGVSPGSGIVGTSVTIAGANFGGAQGGSTITFGGVQATPTSWSAGSIVAPVPAGAVTGNVVVMVGGQASNGSSFTVTVAGPSITNVSPGSGIVGTSVTITGANFGGAQGGSTVTFGGVQAIPTSWSAGSIVTPVPAGAVTGNVVVMVGGQASNGFGFTVPGSGGGTNGYTYQRAVTINANRVPNTDQTNFPVLIYGTYSYLATVANGGSVTNANGYDMIFTSDSAGSNLLKWELVNYNAATGAVEVWVKVPTVSHSANTMIYMWYGNSAVSTFQGGAAGGVWDGNYAGVYHLPNGTTLSANDSTGNENNGTILNGAIASGEIGGGANFNGANAEITTSYIQNSVAAYSIEAWVKTSSMNAAVVVQDRGGWGGHSLTFGLDGANGCGSGVGCGSISGLPSPAGKLLFGDDSNGIFIGAEGTSALNDNNWHHIVGTWSASSGSSLAASQFTLYVDGAKVGSPGTISAGSDTSPVNGSGGTFIGYHQAWNAYYNGVLDEVRISTAVRSADWITAEYNNESNPSSFYSIGAAVSGGGGTSSPVITSLSPTAGPAGTTVTISGSNFGSSQGSSTVRFNGTTAAPTSWSGASITVPVPTGAGTGNVVVTVSGAASNGFGFTMTAPAPSITGVSPGSGIVGTSVTIAGANFGGAQGGSTITFGGVQATPTSWSAGSIVAPVPAGAVTGNVVVMVGGQASNGSSFSVTNPGPSITGVSPGSGIVGTSVTIAGANFGGAQGGSTITFGGVQATPTSWSAGSIVAPVPAGAVTGNVVVMVGGQASNGSSFSVTNPGPSITGVSPGSGIVGTSVTIAGANFGGAQGGSTITFGGVQATPTSWSAGSIVAPVPAGAVTGSVIVTVSGIPSNGFGFTVGETTINWNSVEQRIDGFGASAIDSGGDAPVNLTAAEADFFFTSTGSNLGLSLLRIQIIPSVTDCNAWTASGGDGTGLCIPSSNATTFQGELTVAQAAVARGVSVWASEYSPTATFKSNGVFYQGGALLTNTSNYAAMGTTLASFVTLMGNNGVPIYAVSLQNEPDINQNYPSALWTAQQFHDVVPYVYSAFQAAGVGNTLLMIPEESGWDFSDATSAMSDPTVAAEVGIIAGHGYHGAIVAPPNYGKSVWQSEDSSQSSTYDGSMANGLSWAEKIHSYLATANVNAWVWWFFSDQAWAGDGADDAALTDFNGNPAKRAYVTGQWSKFVRPGWYRIDVTDASGMSVTAFKNPGTGQFAVVVVNSGTANADTFTLNGFNATSVTPWITDATRSLTQQSDVAVSGGAFSYTIPAGSVVTFAGQAQ